LQIDRVLAAEDRFVQDLIDAEYEDEDHGGNDEEVSRLVLRLTTG